MKEAIQKAIEGGWKYQCNPRCDYTVRERDVKVYTNDPDDTKLYVKFIEIREDPLFWQALGKAMGWEQEVENEFGEKELRGSRNWTIKWHRFIDHLAEGKDADSFFKELIK